MTNQSNREKIETFFKKEGPFKDALLQLRRIMLSHGLEEYYKWQMPIYGLSGKNLIGISAFKRHFGIWFMQGALLADRQGKLINAQEGKTVAMRQWRFTTMEELDEDLISAYVKESIEHQKAGREIKSARPIKKAPIPSGILKEALASDSSLQRAFHKLSPGRQKEYIEYTEGAKRESTQAVRLQKIIPMILSGIGLNDKYRRR